MSLKSQIQEIIEGKRKQADIKSDKELTQAGASSSSDPRSKRYSPSLHTMHNDPENIKRRRERAESKRDKRDRRSLAQAAASHKDAPSWAKKLSKRR